MLQNNSVGMPICYELKVIAVFLFSLQTFTLEIAKYGRYRRRKQPFTAWWRAA